MTHNDVSQSKTCQTNQSYFQFKTDLQKENKELEKNLNFDVFGKKTTAD